MLIGWTLLHFVWQAGIVLVIYKCIERNLRFAKPATRYGLALIALVSMALAAAGTLSYEAGVLHRVSPPLSALRVTAPMDTQGLHFVYWRLLHATEHFSVVRFMPWLDLAWLSGVVFLTIRTLGGLCALKSIRSESWEAPSLTIERLRTLVAKMNLSRSVALRLHPYIASPFVAGSIRSVIYLPFSAFTQLDPEQLDAILAHELAHIRRADFAWNLIQRMIETMFFFHPAVWYLSAVLREQRELCCDDDVLAIGADPLKYAKALLALANLIPAPSVAMASDGHQACGLLPRVARILEHPRPSDRTLWLAWPIRHLMTSVGLIAVTIPLFTTSFSRPASQVRVVNPVTVRTEPVVESHRTPLAKSQHRIKPSKLITVRALALGDDRLLTPIHDMQAVSSDVTVGESTDVYGEVSSSWRWTILHPAAHANANADAHAAPHAHANAHLHTHVNRHDEENAGIILGTNQVGRTLEYGS